MTSNSLPALFDEYQRRLKRFFRSRGFSEDEARDLTQEALMRVFQNMGALRSQVSLDSWILRVAATIWKNEIRHRKTKKRDAPEVPLDDSATDHEAIESAAREVQKPPSPLGRVLAAERLTAVSQCLDRLPPGMRRCLILHVFQERKYQQIADLLCLSIQSVKSHIHQARQHLGDCVARRLAGNRP